GSTSVKTAQATEGPISASLSYTGDVKAVSQVAVLPKATGRLEKLLVDVGSKVKKGDAIASLDASSLKVQVAQAKANLAAAQARLANMQAGSRDEQVGQAKAALEAAQARANTAHKGATDAQLAGAQTAVDQAAANLQSAQARLQLVKQGPTQTQWWQALSAVDTARANMKSTEAKLADVKAGAKAADLQSAEAAVESARASLYAADDKRSYAGDNNSVPSLAQLGVTSAGQAGRNSEAAQANYDAAVAKLNLLKSYPLPADLQAAQSGYDVAKAQYDATSNAVDDMKRMPKPEDVQQAQAAVDAAQATLNGAQAQLKQLSDGPTEDDLKVVDSGVEQARQLYNLAVSPYTRHDLDASKAAVDQAQAAVDLAQIAFNDASVTSPVDGAVSDKLLSEGALVGPQTPIVSVISSDVELVLGVEESQIGQVKEEQKAEISVAAFPGVLFPARVAMIAPSADPKSRTFQVKIRPDLNDGKLRPGMFAQVNVVTQEKPKAVLVPKESVLTRSGQTVVFVLTGDTVQMRTVKLGLSRNGTVEIASGVNAGEEVVVAGQNDLRDGDKVKKS
ncbi:MAG: efflux RND transporter periplasmic adaptor subunit, partial [Bacteroidetes bacterium]|nr:efflux RND transporter periplasmic adaptor subunit [Bacteroidota bacterium]